MYAILLATLQEHPFLPGHLCCLSEQEWIDLDESLPRKI
jgi:hypothetical protein